MTTLRCALTIWLACLLVGCALEAQERTAVFTNPVIPGFAPDPSVVRVGDDFWLINSTFEYFPGIPIYHSKDLVSWELVNYALTRPSQADLASLKSSDGIHASTIRYHDGTYYIITTNNVDGRMVNFIVTSPDPRDEWSEPHILAGAPGIDPSLFFDDDGRAWYVGNHIPADPDFPGQAEIWLQEVDLEEMALTGQRHYLWRGCCGGVWAEGPHIYKRDGYYYLLISEGGTSFDHAMAVAISKDIAGPYESNSRNPVLTHRHLSYDYPISGVGHADLVELKDGRWYAVALGWRLADGEHGILGRETFLVPVRWETEPYRWKDEKLTWPVFSPETGKVELEYDAPFGEVAAAPAWDFADEFDSEALNLEWNFRRTPASPFYRIDANSGSLQLDLQGGAFREQERYSFMGIRQRHFEFEASTQMALYASGTDDEAGMALVMNDRSALVYTVTTEGVLQLRHHRDGEIDTLATKQVNTTDLQLQIVGDYLDLSFHYAISADKWETLAFDVDGSVLSPESIGGYNYTGTYVGLYGSSNGQASGGHARFEYLRYRPIATNDNAWFHRERIR